VEQLRFPVAQRGRVPDLAREREAEAHERDHEEDREVGEAAFAARRHRYHSANVVPSLAWPGAPLFTSYTPVFCGSCGGTATQVSFFSVMGSTGMLRRYFSETSVSSVSGYLPLSP